MVAQSRIKHSIPDNSKPTVTWGRKAMGQFAGPHPGNVVARPPKESRP